MSETWAKDGDRAHHGGIDLHLDLPGPKSQKGIRLGLETARLCAALDPEAGLA
jgi:hypothetical protein